jgi:DNA-directed RNA polymerase subunit RPC12/RpoP
VQPRAEAAPATVAAAKPLVVSTACPTCGAPLDFGEGSNAVRCEHCRSALLVTGRTQLLSYTVAPTVGARDAAAAVKFACAGTSTRIGLDAVRLWYVPYYRLRGDDLRWEKSYRVRERPDPEALIEGQSDTIYRRLVAEPEEREVVVELRGRRVERNFLACRIPGVPLYSLGVRPAVLRLELFDRAALAVHAVVVAPAITADDALAHGLRAEDPRNLVHREVLCRVLSVVYFPFWTVVLQRGRARTVAMVDGVSGTLVPSDVDAAVLGALEAPPAAGTARAAGFRPLVCPNCGWDLAVEPEHVIFPCGACARAWELRGEELRDLTHVVAAAPERVRPARYLPFWILDARGGRRFHVAAFGHRSLKTLHDLSRDLSEADPRVEADTPDRPTLHGGRIDAADAPALARMVLAGNAIVDARLREPPRLEVERATLAWLPFTSDGYSLRDTFGVGSLPERLLL